MKSEFTPPIGQISQISGKCISLIGNDIDTDRIIPARFLKCVNFDSLGESDFEDDRKTLKGTHPFDLKENQDSSILIVNSNFGCGSSREHAVWALKDFGIKTVIAESLADIFYNNCFKNGLLALCLKKSEISKIFDNFNEDSAQSIEIDLINQVLSYGDSEFKFELDDYKKKCLLEGLDEIGASLKFTEQIKSFEKNYQIKNPWLFK